MIIEIEIDGRGDRRVRDEDTDLLVTRQREVNSDWYAPFLQERLRGAFDYARCRDRDGASKSIDLPGGVPGQRLRLDTDRNVGAVVEPLVEEQYASLRKRLVKLLGREREARLSDNPLGLGPAAREIPLSEPRDLATWLHWMKRAVAGGQARIVRGQLPDSVPGKPRTRFFTPEPGPDRFLESQRVQQALQIAMLTPEQRAAFDAEMARLRGSD